jgi:hypothetical protein
VIYTTPSISGNNAPGCRARRVYRRECGFRVSGISQCYG